MAPQRWPRDSDSHGICLTFRRIPDAYIQVCSLGTINDSRTPEPDRDWNRSRGQQIEIGGMYSTSTYGGVQCRYTYLFFQQEGTGKQWLKPSLGPQKAISHFPRDAISSSHSRAAEPRRPTSPPQSLGHSTPPPPLLCAHSGALHLFVLSPLNPAPRAVPVPNSQLSAALPHQVRSPPPRNCSPAASPRPRLCS